ncbi:IQ domain-containing protein IQM1-like [Canna indica]|uniref:IQ domain-containing protein IQM1-like n=1 Tax=Canna indica TaxID=4628 RepID=A0AAQ3PXV5_9LILI|nr:IQ domain-containing protein IQM1-like [Canna indica]
MSCISSSALPSRIKAELSCHGTEYDHAVNESLEALLMRSISFGDDVIRSTVKSISFNGRGSVSFNGRRKDPNRRLGTNFAVKSHTFRAEKPTFLNPLKKRSLESACPKHQAALKLQKVYKSFRTRRQLADCAVLVEQRWWKLLDFAMLKLSSISFFDIEKPESAVSRWSRARTRAAKVGKGLSKDEKAQKLALQHWLEAIDPRHRYGHNLQFYYDCWLQCESMEPFFYWLDVGEGKEVNLEEQCARSKLQQQCIKYLGPKEREAYEVIIEDGKFMYKQSTQILDTSGGGKDDKWIFVLSTSRNLYVGQKMKGKFQHSSFLAGGATSAAGQLVVENGVLKTVWPHSGHYRPTQENFQEFKSFLEDNKVDLTDVKTSPTKDGHEHQSGLRNSDSEVNLAEPETEVNMPCEFSEKTRISEAFEGVNNNCSLADLKVREQEKATRPLEMQLPGDDEHHEESEEPHRTSARGEYKLLKDVRSPNRYHIFRKMNLFPEEQEEEEEAFVPSESIFKRINSKKEIKSYQLGRQLPFKWTTGAGPRIGCVRDYPWELQFRALEQVSLSPRSGNVSRFASPRTAKCAATKGFFSEARRAVVARQSREW